MTAVPPSEDWDVIAYDEHHNVLMVWSGCPEVTQVAELPANNRMTKIIIETAELVRRRDGYVLKSRDGATGFPAEQTELVLPDPDEAPEPKPKVRELKRVDLIPPPEELPEHDPLDDAQMLEVALFTALSLLDSGEVEVDDKDIVRALSKGSISIEHYDDGTVVYRAHVGRLNHFRVGQVEADAVTEAKIAAYNDAISVLDEAFENVKAAQSITAYKNAVKELVQLKGLVTES